MCKFEKKQGELRWDGDRLERWQQMLDELATPCERVTQHILLADLIGMLINLEPNEALELCSGLWLGVDIHRVRRCRRASLLVGTMRAVRLRAHCECVPFIVVWVAIENAGQVVVGGRVADLQFVPIAR